MQEVKVADIKVKDGVTASGARAGQKWELVIIVGDDGSEFTTFDSKAKEVGIGGVIELEPVLKNGKVNFTKFIIKGKGQAAPPTQVASNGGDSPGKRKSVEDQVRAYIIADLFNHDKSTPELTIKLQDWLMKLGDEAVKPASREAQPSAQSTTEGIETGEFANVGQFLAACNKQFGISRATVLAEMGVSDAIKITNLWAAWQTICAIHSPG